MAGRCSFCANKEALWRSVFRRSTMRKTPSIYTRPQLPIAYLPLQRILVSGQQILSCIRIYSVTAWTNDRKVLSTIYTHMRASVFGNLQLPSTSCRRQWVGRTLWAKTCHPNAMELDRSKGSGKSKHVPPYSTGYSPFKVTLSWPSLQAY